MITITKTDKTDYVQYSAQFSGEDWLFNLRVSTPKIDEVARLAFLRAAFFRENSQRPHCISALNSFIQQPTEIINGKT